MGGLTVVELLTCLSVSANATLAHTSLMASSLSSAGIQAMLWVLQLIPSSGCPLYQKKLGQASTLLVVKVLCGPVQYLHVSVEIHLS